MVSFKSVFYPDGFTEDGRPNGPKVMTLSFRIDRTTRYKRMTDEENVNAIALIEEFEKKLAIFKSRFQPPKTNP